MADDIKEWTRALLIDKHTLDEAWEQHPDVFHRVAERVAILTSQRDAAKQELAEIEARVDADLRHEAEVAGEKITEKSIESQKLLDSKVIKAKEQIAKLSYDLGVVQALKEAFLQRSYALKDLVSLWTAGYYSNEASAGAERRGKGFIGDRAKEALSEARKERPVRR